VGKALIRQEAITREAVKRSAQDVGMVFQSFNLFPHLSVLENLCVAPVMLRGWIKRPHGSGHSPC
jgi:polar amino acid transport system ATP-binding protein